MISVVDKHVTSKTILLKKISGDSCIVNLVWKENLLFLFIIFFIQTTSSSSNIFPSDNTFKLLSSSRL